MQNVLQRARLFVAVLLKFLADLSTINFLFTLATRPTDVILLSLLATSGMLAALAPFLLGVGIGWVLWRPLSHAVPRQPLRARRTLSNAAPQNALSPQRPRTRALTARRARHAAAP